MESGGCFFSVVQGEGCGSDVVEVEYGRKECSAESVEMEVEDEISQSDEGGIVEMMGWSTRNIDLDGGGYVQMCKEDEEGPDDTWDAEEVDELIDGISVVDSVEC